MNLTKLLSDFGVHTEDQLSSLLVKNSLTLPCQGGCKKEIEIENIEFFNGDPYCKTCLEKVKTKLLIDKSRNLWYKGVIMSDEPSVKLWQISNVDYNDDRVDEDEWEDEDDWGDDDED